MRYAEREASGLSHPKQDFGIDINCIPGMTRYHYNIYSDDGYFLEVLEIFPDLEDKEVATQKAHTRLKDANARVTT